MQLLRSRLGQSPQTVGQRRRISKCPSARGAEERRILHDDPSSVILGALH